MFGRAALCLKNATLCCGLLSQLQTEVIKILPSKRDPQAGKQPMMREGRYTATACIDPPRLTIASGRGDAAVRLLFMLLQLCY